MRVRLQDIARDLNLSTMTISRVLRGHADVSEQTKTRVLQRALELKYRPNSSARGLRTGQAFRVGVLVPCLSEAYYAEICQGLTTILQDAGYGVGLSTSAVNADYEDTQIESHLSHHVDALFFVGRGSGEIPGEHDVPVFCVGRDRTADSAYTLDFKQSDIGRLAAVHLLERGARRVAYLRGSRTAAADERFCGFLEAHRKAGVQPQQQWVREIRSATNDYREGFEATKKMLHERLAPDAVMANTDGLALGARDAALAHGLELPNAFQVIGCGNDSALCSIGMPLTSVAFSGQDLGNRAAALALKVISDSDTRTTRRVLLNPSIVFRDTTRKLEQAPRVFERKRRPK